MAEIGGTGELKRKQAKEKLSEADKIIRRLDRLFSSTAKQVGVIGQLSSIDPDKPFDITKYPDINKKVDNLIQSLYKSIEVCCVNGVRSQWTLANNHLDELTRVVFGDKINDLSNAQKEKYFNNHDKALEGFLERKEKGLNLSQRVWRYEGQTKNEIESALELGIKTGESALTLATHVKEYLRHPDKLFRRIRDKESELHLSTKAADFHPGQGVYRSSYMNAKRLVATETNMAYDAADYTRRQDLDFVVGIKVILSGNHTCLNSKGVPEPFYDICDELSAPRNSVNNKGRGCYPKDFKFTGWHPFCYDDKSEVLTSRGWKLFQDVNDDDLVFSLRQDNLSVEWSSISRRMMLPYRGPMVHFRNRSLDVLVTPDHPMVYIRDGKIQCDKRAKDIASSVDIYRSSRYDAPDVESIKIGRYNIDFDLFCEFMGYWLSDGSLVRNLQISITQDERSEPRTDIISCIDRMGFKAHDNKGKINFYCRDLCQYLRQFGHAYDKYVPDEIKNASKRQIGIFLDAFVTCDGYIRPPKPFIGNRGTMCKSRVQRVFCSSSPRLQADLGECLVKIGKRPSYQVNSIKGTKVSIRGKEYRTNYDCVSISECSSTTATQYNKEIIDYDGLVYDLELERNHVMYIRRNGKCFWGSNCRCIATSILKTEEELMRDMDGIDRGSKYQVREMPSNFVKWQQKNIHRIEAAVKRGTVPYFWKENVDVINKPTGPTILERAQARHDARTEEQVKAIKSAWEERQETI